MAVIAWVSVDQAIDPHQDARPATEVLETVDPVSVLVGLLHAHAGSVAQELQAQCEIGCGSERLGTPQGGPLSLLLANIPLLKASGARADRAQLGRFDGLPAARAGAIPAGLGRVIRHQPVPTSSARTGKTGSGAGSECAT